MDTEMSDVESNRSLKNMKGLFTHFCNEIRRPSSESSKEVVLLHNIDELEYILSRLGNAHMEELAEEFQLSKDVLMLRKLVGHVELDVRVSVASCIGEIIRISVPNQPFSDCQMKVFFKLANAAYENLSSTKSKAPSILKAVSDSQSCVIMLDLDLYSEIHEMFHLFLDNISTKHTDATFSSMTNIMSLLIQQSWDCDNLSVELITIVLSRLRKELQVALPSAFDLAKTVFENCAHYIRAYLSEAVARLRYPVDQYDDVVQSLYQEITQQENVDKTRSTGDASRCGEVDQATNRPFLKPGFLRPKSRKHSAKGKRTATEQSPSEKIKEHTSMTEDLAGNIPIKEQDSESRGRSFIVYSRKHKRDMAYMQQV